MCTDEEEGSVDESLTTVDSDDASVGTEDTVMSGGSTASNTDIAPPRPEKPTKNPYRKTISTKNLPREAKINIACDGMASETTATIIAQRGHPEMPPTLELPYEGSKALLKIGSQWVTSKCKRAIHRARSTDTFRTYCREKYGWDEDEFKWISWKSIGRVRRRQNRQEFRQSSKILHGWLPTAHMVGHATGNTQCPGCTCSDETLHHMLRCPHQLMKKKREEIIAALRKKGVKARVPRRVLDSFIALLEHYLCDGEGDPMKGIKHGGSRKAAHQQMAVGLEYMARGFLVEAWQDAIAATGARNPERKMDTLQRLVWGSVVQPLWLTRNDILHGKENKHKEHEESTLMEKISWYVRHRGSLLSFHDQSLAEIDLSRLHRMKRATKQAWVRHLDIARKAYVNELRQRASKQNVITRYFVPRRRS